MKTQWFSTVGLIVLALLLSGCSSVKGTYACSGGLFLKSISLDSGDKAIVTGSVFGMTQQKIGTYSVNGDNVIVTVDGSSTRFSHKNKTLDGGELVGRCTAQ